MPTDQITLKFDAQTSSAATALQELTAPIEKLSASFATLSNSISKDLVSSLKAITTPLHSVSKSFDTLGSGAKNVKNNISEAVAALKQISTGGLSSDLGKVIQQFDVLAQSPAAKGFGNIAISMQRLGAGVSAISSATKKHKEFSVSVLEVSRSLKTLITAYEGLGGLGQMFKNNEGVSEFTSKWTQGFSQVIPLLTRFSNAMKTLETVGNKKIKIDSIDVSAFKNSVSEVISVVNTLITSLGAYGGKSSKNILAPSKDVVFIKQISSFINPLMEGLSEVTNLVNRFISVVSSSKNRLSNIKPAIQETMQIVDDLIVSLGAYMGKTSKSVLAPTKDGFFIKQISSYINPLMEGLSEVINLVNRFISVVSSSKTRLANIKPAIQEAVKVVDDLITSLGSYMGKTSKSVLAPTKDGFFIKEVFSYINPLLEGFSEVTTLVNRFISALSSSKTRLSEAIPAVREAMKVVDDLITSLGAYMGKTSKSTTTSSKGGFLIKEVSSYINPLMEGLSEVINLLDKFSKTLARFKNFSADFPKAVKSTYDSVNTFIENIGSLDSGKLSSFERLADSMYKMAEGMKYLRASSKSASSVVSRANKVISDTSTNAEKATKSLHWLSGGWKSVVTAFAGGTVIYSTVRFIKEAAMAFVDLDREMRLVNVVVRGTEENLAAMTKEVFNVASQFGLGAQKIAKSLYEINQATIVGADSLEVLRNAAKMAVAGNTDVTKSSKLLAATLKAYAKSVNESSHLADIFFKIQERGIITIDELTQYGQRLFATFSSAGIPIEEMGAALSTLTARGLQANIAVTALNSLVLKLSSGNAKLNKIFEMAGDSTSANALRTKGLAYTMQVLQNATNGALSSLTRLGFNYRDIRAATILANDIGGTYAENLAIFSDRTQIAGASQKAYNELLKSFSQQLRVIKESLANSIIQITDFVGKWTGLTTVIELLRSFLNSTNPIIVAIRSITSGVLKFVAAFTIIAGSIVLVVGLFVKAKAAITTLIRSFVAMAATTRTNTATLGVFGTGLKTVTGLFGNATNAVREYIRELIRLRVVSNLKNSNIPVADTGLKKLRETGYYEIDPKAIESYISKTKKATKFTDSFRKSTNSLGSYFPTFRKGILSVKTAFLGLAASVKALLSGFVLTAVITGVLWALGKAISAIKTAKAQKDLENLRKSFEELKIETSNSISIDAKVVGLAQLDALQKKMLEVKAVLGETSPEFRQLQDEMNKFRESLGKVVSATTDAQIQLALDDQAKAITKAWEGSLTSGQRLVILQNDLANAVQKYNKLQASKAPAETIAAQIKEVTKLQVAVLGLEQQAINTQQALIRAFSNRFVNVQGTDELDTYRLKVSRLQDIYKKLSDKGLAEGVDFSAIIGNDYNAAVKAFAKLKKNIDGVALSAQKLAKEGYIDQLKSSLAKIDIDVNLSAESVTTELSSKIRKAIEAGNKAAQQYTDVSKKGTPTSLTGALDRAASLDTFYSSRSNLIQVTKGKSKDEAEIARNGKYYSEIKQSLSTILKLRTRLASSKGDPLTGEDWVSARKAVLTLNKYTKSVDLLGTTNVSNKRATAMQLAGAPFPTNALGEPVYTIPKELDAVYSALTGSDTFDKNFLKGFSNFTNKFNVTPTQLTAPQFKLPDTRSVTAELNTLYGEAQNLATSLPNETLLKNKEALEVWQHAFERATDVGKVNMLNNKLVYLNGELRKAKTTSEKILIQGKINKFTNNLEKVNEDIRKRDETIRNTFNKTLDPVAAAREAALGNQETVDNYVSFFSEGAKSGILRRSSQMKKMKEEMEAMLPGIEEAASKGGDALVEYRKNMIKRLSSLKVDSKYLNIFQKVFDSILKSGAILPQKYKKQVQDRAQKLYESGLPMYKKEELARKRLAKAQEALNKASSPKERVAAFDEYQDAWKDVVGMIKQSSRLSPEVRTSQATVAGTQEAYNLIKRSEKHDYNLDTARNTALIYSYLRKNLVNNAKAAGVTLFTE